MIKIRRRAHTGLVMLACVVSALAPDRGRAAGYALDDQSALSQGSSFAGATARAEDPSTLAANPAGITRLDGYQISIGAAVIDADSRLSAASASTDRLLGAKPIAGSSSGNPSPTSLLPSLFATAALTPDLHVGLAVTSPFGIETKYDTNSIARYYALTTDMRTVDIAPTIAYRLAPKLSVSATLVVESETVRLSNAVDFGAIGALSGLSRSGLLPGSADGFGSFHGQNISVGYQLGTLYQPSSTTRLGLSYRSAIDHTLHGSQDYQSVPTLLRRNFIDGAASAQFPTPARLSLGGAHDLDSWTLIADLQWTQWSRLRTLNIVLASGQPVIVPQHLRDGAMVAIGADYRLDPAWTVRAGVSVDPTPTTNTYRGPNVPDATRTRLSAGATWQVIPLMAVSAAYSQLFLETTSIALADGGPGTPNFLRGNLVAHVNSQADIVSLQTTFRF